MTEYFLSLTPEAPIRAGSLKPKGDYLDTKNYLPGSILRGAFAEWLKLQGKESQIIPMVRKIRFGNFFPSPSERIPALPFPMTVLECKLHGGFETCHEMMNLDMVSGIVYLLPLPMQSLKKEVHAFLFQCFCDVLTQKEMQNVAAVWSG